jgi:hypothetical protein
VAGLLRCRGERARVFLRAMSVEAEAPGRSNQGDKVEGE